MVIYGIALRYLHFDRINCREVAWRTFGIDANVGGIGIAMFLLMILSNYQNFKLSIGDISESGITLESNLYTNSGCYAAKQNVVGALDGGFMALVAGIVVVSISFLFIPLLSNLKDK